MACIHYLNFLRAGLEPQKDRRDVSTTGFDSFFPMLLAKSVDKIDQRDRLACERSKRRAKAGGNNCRCQPLACNVGNYEELRSIGKNDRVHVVAANLIARAGASLNRESWNMRHAFRQ